MKKFNKKELAEKIRKHSGELIIAIVVLVLFVLLLSGSIPFFGELFNKDTEPITEETTSGEETTNLGNEITEPTEYPYWKPISYNGLSDVGSFRGRDVWVNGSTVYYSCGTAGQLVLNGNTWDPVRWKGVNTYIVGRYVWTDGTNVYYSGPADGSFDFPRPIAHYVLNGDTWEKKTWNGLTDFYGDCIWTDGTNVYYSKGAKHYVLNDGTWEEKTWNGLTNFSGSNVWTDGSKMYYSDGSVHYVLNGNTWEGKTWNGLNGTSVSGIDIWTDGTNVYYSGDKQSNQWKLDTETDTWNKITWIWENTTYKPQFTGEYVWTDGTHVYYSDGPWYYVLVCEP